MSNHIFAFYFPFLSGPAVGGLMFASIFFTGIVFLTIMHMHLKLLQEGSFPFYWRANTKSYVEIFTRLSATMISKETSHAREKMKYIHSTMHTYFPDVQLDYRKSIVFTYRFPIKTTSYTNWILKRMSKAERLKLMQFLIALAAIDGAIEQHEYAFIKGIAQQIQIPMQEIDSIVEMHKNRFKSQEQSAPPDGYSTATQLERSLAHFGLQADATWQEVKQTYRSLAKKCHPDAYNQATEEIRKQKHVEFLTLQEIFLFLEKRMG
jgi:hypothetical protein